MTNDERNDDLLADIADLKATRRLRGVLRRLLRVFLGDIRELTEHVARIAGASASHTASAGQRFDDLTQKLDDLENARVADAEEMVQMRVMLDEVYAATVGALADSEIPDSEIPDGEVKEVV